MPSTTTDPWAAEWQEELERRAAEQITEPDDEMEELVEAAWTENLPHVLEALTLTQGAPLSWHRRPAPRMKMIHEDRGWFGSRGIFLLNHRHRRPAGLA